MAMEKLAAAIRKCLPAAIKEFNEVRLPHLEEFFGRDIITEFPDPKKRTSETTKVLVRGLDNTFYRHIHALEPSFVEDEGAGRDYCFEGIPIESKNTFGKGDTWTGNGYDKTGWHFLKKFTVNDTGRIVSVFVALVNLNNCAESKWSERTLKSNFSSLPLKTVDRDHVMVIVGTLKSNRVNLCPEPIEVASLQTLEN